MARGEDDEAPWHDPTIVLPERMTMAQGKPLRRRLMAAMAQQDCGQCGYTCETYADEIVQQAEERLNLCVPGGKETARMLKKLIEEMGGGATDPDEEKAKAEARAAARLEPRAPLERGYSREAPVEARFLSATTAEQGRVREGDLACRVRPRGRGARLHGGRQLRSLPDQRPRAGPVGDRGDRRAGRFPDRGQGARAGAERGHVAVARARHAVRADLLQGGRRAQGEGQDEDPNGDAATLDVLAAVAKFAGIRPDPEAFFERLEGLRPRLYSISSSPKVDANRLSLTVDRVRYEIEGEGRSRLGVASTFLSRTKPGAPLKVYIQRAHNFALPADPATPIVMVGPGTGVAPFRAFLHDRMAAQAPGDAWLFFGHRRKDCDFFYEDEFLGLQDRQVLTRLSLAWSRDAETPKTYVQDRMRAEGAELWSWLQRGAHFYVCGDAKRMAADVEKGLVEVAMLNGGHDEKSARAFVADLRKAGRYQADVY